MGSKHLPRRSPTRPRTAAPRGARTAVGAPARSALEPLESRVLLSAYYLSPGGADGAAGTQAAPWKTLSYGLGRVQAGDELVLRAGSYAGGVSVQDANLTIRSYPGERASISAPTTSSGTQQAISFDVTSSGSRLQGLDVSGGYYYAVKLETEWDFGSRAARNITIEDCVLHDSGRDVVKITPDCNDVTIRRTEIFNSGRRDASNAEGIDDVNGDRLTVQDCYIHDIATNGLYAKGGASNAVIERNRIERVGGTGVSLGYVLTDSPFFDASNTTYYESIDSTVRNNLISDTPNAGVALYGALRPRVYNNTLVNVAKSGQGGIMVARGEVDVSGDGAADTFPPSRDAAVSNNIVVTASRPNVLVRAGGLEGSLTMATNRYFKSAGGSASFSDERGGFSGTLSQWKARVGTDTSSTEGDPLLDAGFHLTASSPAINTGTDLSATGFIDDVDAQSRPAGSAWDVGADEYNGAVTPPPADTTAPTISGVASSNVTQGGATISWNTNEASDTQVEYGTTTSYGSASALDAARVTGHSASLSALTAGTVYHYRVKSRDAAGNLAISGDFSFTTAAPQPDPQPQPAGTVFSPVGFFGDFANYTPLTASRWTVAPDAGATDARLTINTTDITPAVEDVPGEYALVSGRAYGDFDMTVRAKTNESLSANPSADYVVVFGRQDASNFWYLMMSGRATNTRLFRVSNGVPTPYPSAATAGVPDANWHDVRVTRTGSTVTARLDGAQLLSLTDPALASAGGVGVGSYNDAASFDDVNVTVPTPAPAPDTTPPAAATFSAANVTAAGATTHALDVTYTDNVSVSIASLDGNDVLVTGPNNFSQLAALSAISATTDGSPLIATYRITPPGSAWDSADNGTYTLALRSGQVSDTAGNFAAARTLGSFIVSVPTPPPPPPEPSGSLNQTTAADFSTGTSSGTAVTSTAGGEIRLATFSDEFDRTALGADWTTNAWSSSGSGPASVTLASGALTVLATQVRSSQDVAGATVEGRVSFAPAKYQHFGVATNLDTTAGNSWAIFSTSNSGNTLYARVNANGTVQDVSLGALPTGMHLYKIQPAPDGGFQFSIDGVVKTTIAKSIPAGTKLKAVLSDFRGNAATPLAADWVRTSASLPRGTYVSSVFDAGAPSTWGIADWTADVPAGTSIVVETSSGDTATPDGSWSAWQSVSDDGTVASPAGRFLRYRVTMVTGDPSATATLYDISFNWT